MAEALLGVQGSENFAPPKSAGQFLSPRGTPCLPQKNAAMPDKSKDKYEKIFQWQNLSSMDAILRRNQCLILASEIFRPLNMVYALRLSPI
jgi:hypothetical protein